RRVPEGCRNKTLFSCCLKWFAFGVPFEQVLILANDFNQHQAESPMPESEVVKTVGSAARYEAEGRNWAGRGGRLDVPSEIPERLTGHRYGGDAALLYLKLRKAHWRRDEFA